VLAGFLGGYGLGLASVCCDDAASGGLGPWRTAGNGEPVASLADKAERTLMAAFSALIL
jgi:hypothetical protein